METIPRLDVEGFYENVAKLPKDEDNCAGPPGDPGRLHRRSQHSGKVVSSDFTEVEEVETVDGQVPGQGGPRLQLPQHHARPGQLLVVRFLKKTNIFHAKLNLSMLTLNICR